MHAPHFPATTRGLRNENTDYTTMTFVPLSRNCHSSQHSTDSKQSKGASGFIKHVEWKPEESENGDLALPKLLRFCFRHGEWKNENKQDKTYIWLREKLFIRPVNNISWDAVKPTLASNSNGEQVQIYPYAGLKLGLQDMSQLPPCDATPSYNNAFLIFYGTSAKEALGSVMEVLGLPDTLPRRVHGSKGPFRRTVQVYVPSHFKQMRNPSDEIDDSITCSENDGAEVPILLSSSTISRLYVLQNQVIDWYGAEVFPSDAAVALQLENVDWVDGGKELAAALDETDEERQFELTFTGVFNIKREIWSQIFQALSRHGRNDASLGHTLRFSYSSYPAGVLLFDRAACEALVKVPLVCLQLPSRSTILALERPDVLKTLILNGKLRSLKMSTEFGSIVEVHLVDSYVCRALEADSCCMEHLDMQELYDTPIGQQDIPYARSAFPRCMILALRKNKSLKVLRLCLQYGMDDECWRGFLDMLLNHPTLKRVSLSGMIDINRFNIASRRKDIVQLYINKPQFECFSTNYGNLDAGDGANGIDSCKIYNKYRSKIVPQLIEPFFSSTSTPQQQQCQLLPHICHQVAQEAPHPIATYHFLRSYYVPLVQDRHDK